jgi:hypothetical protein
VSHLVAQCTITSNQNVARHRLPKYLDLQDIGNDLLGLPVQIRVNERDVIITDDDVSQSAQPLLDPLEGDLGGEGISEVL